LPTGGGKSICFQVPALCVEGLCLVVSPLIALMKDQVFNLRKKGIEAYALYAGQSKSEMDRILDNCAYGQVKFLYLSPERLKSQKIKERIRGMNVSLLAIDEAHCISQWGYDFRPAYLEISEIRAQLKSVPVIALTATATKKVVADIQKKLLFDRHAQVFQKSFARSNLSYVVIYEENKMSKMLEILKTVQGSSVIYVQNRKACRDIAYYLYQRGISAEYYHAGRLGDIREKVQQRWIDDEVRVIVATNAFGMGININ
jgi:ATP-dependent DNA helicase RecQ